MLLRPISSPPVPAMNDKQEVDVMTQFLASIEGGEQAEKQTVLFALDNYADDHSQKRHRHKDLSSFHTF